jgi:nitroreductase
MKLSFCAVLLAIAVHDLAARSLPLPAPQKTGGLPLMEALARRATARAFDPRDLTLQQLADLLWAGFGVNRPDGKRTAPSANNQQATDIYVLLKQGAYVYNARSNQLDLVVAGDLRRWGATQAFATNAPVTLVFIADFARMGSGGDEGKRAMANINVGYISQNIYLYCASEGLATGARASLDRPTLGARLGLRPEQVIILAQSIGFPKNSERPAR